MKKRAAVFAGQGAQSVGMGKDLAEQFPDCRKLFDRANEVLGFDLARLCFEGPLDQLTRSDNCQPAVFVTSMACYTGLRNIRPEGDLFSAMAGLSLGEWSALHAAGALSYEETLQILRARGRFMQEACEEREGGMVSVMGLPLEEVRKICAAAGVEIANLNSPEQTVLSGERPRIAEAEKIAQAAGAKRTVVLNVAGAYHSPLMGSAAAKLEARLAQVNFQPPRVPVVSNVTGQPHTAPDEIRRLMVKQVTSPVQWVSSVQWMRNAGAGVYVECGPGKVLAGLIKRVDNEGVTHSIQDSPTLAKAAPSV